MARFPYLEDPNASRPLYTREETLAVLNLYRSMPFGQIHDYDKRVVRLAKLLGRPSASVCKKMVNLASYDPQHIRRGVKGLKRPCKTERLVWEEFERSPENALYESEQLLAELEGATLESKIPLEPEILAMPEGRERERIVRTRVNQEVFRRIVLSAYADACCITDINEPTLLVASHIVPWSANPKERMNPCNGLCLNALHDRAFDRGLISVDPKYVVRVSPRLLKRVPRSEKIRFIAESDGAKIRVSDRFPPSPKFLKYHYQNIFAGA